MGLPDHGKDDATVRLIRGRPDGRRGRRIILGVCVVLVVAAGALGGWWYGSQPTSVPVVARTPITLADEAGILANRDGDPAVLRFADNHAVLVLDFAGLHAQGAMLNRVAAMVEKAGLPRDRVLNDAELAQAIGASGSTADTYYYGHDYRAADLARFFARAEEEHIGLTPQELWLRGLLAQEGWLQPDARGALISLPRQSAGPDGAPGLDAAGLATILRHELSHGEYFTSSAYADWTRQFWQRVLDPQERSLFRHFLAGEGYDATQEDLMMNETQAYLMHTPDRRFFSAAALGAPPEQVFRLRQAFFQGMPPGWLRDATPAPVASAAAGEAAARPRRRSRQRCGVVSSNRAPAARRTPRLRAESSAA